MPGNILNKNISARWTIAILALVLVGGGAIGALFVYRPWERPRTVVVPAEEVGSLPGPKEPLAVGSGFPPLEAAGWSNGAPPAWGEGSSPLVVVDVWALW